MSRPPAFLAIDLGAESGRAALGTLEDGRVTLTELHRFANRPCRLPTGWHWDLCGLWREALEGVRRAVAFAEQHDQRLISIGVDTWGVDFGLMGVSGELLLLPRCYRDPRNDAAMRETVASIGAGELYARTGIQPMAFNTLFQLVALRQAEPALLERSERLLFMPDLFHYLLSGSRAVERSIASTSQLLDVRTGAWDIELAGKCGLPAHIFPPLSDAGADLGPLSPHVAEQVGARDAVRVITPASHDTASAIAATPGGSNSDCCTLSSGTWSLLGAELEQPCVNDAARAAPFTNERGLGGTICFLKNVPGLWLVQECKRSLEMAGQPRDYERLVQAAAAAPPFVTLIDPEHPDFATPGDMPAKIAAYAERVGQPAPCSDGALIRCCLESLVLSVRRALGQLEGALGRRFGAIRMVGGGVRNRLLCQMTADTTGRRVICGAPEATAMGNVLAQALGAGFVRDREAVRAVAGASQAIHTFEPREPGGWEAAAARFAELSSRSGG